MTNLRIGPVIEPAAQPAPAPADAPAAAPAAPVAADPVAAERERVLTIQAMAQTGEENLRDDLIGNGSSISVATRAFNQNRREIREANAAVRRVETPRPLPAVQGLSPAPAIDPSLPIEQRAQAEWRADKNLHVEFGGSEKRYIAYRRAEDSGALASLSRGAPKPGKSLL